MLTREELFSGPEGITFQDFNIMPGFINFHASDVKLRTRLTRNLQLPTPFISAPMDTVTDGRVAAEIGYSGGIGIIHYNNTVEEQIKEVLKVPEGYLRAAAVSTREKDKERVQALINIGVHIILIDSAQGWSQFQIDMIKFIKERGPRTEVIAGNVVTGEQARGLMNAGADALRVGMGSGSICTTQDVLAVGRAQASAIYDVVKSINGRIPVIADGGISKFGHIARALAVGADTVMLGNLIAGCEETPALVQFVGKDKFKVYRGMASSAAIETGGDKRYGTNSEKITVEQGVTGLVPYVGSLKDRMEAMKQALRQSLQDMGVKHLWKIREGDLRFERRSLSAQLEGSPHDLKNIL